ncbi:MAG: DUF4347 domain-containing protein, partial [Methylococcaceae bacterium]
MSTSNLTPSLHHQVVFVLDNLPDWQTLAAAVGSDADLIVLNANADALAQMVSALANRKDLAAIHLLSHGAAGALSLGTTTLDSQTLQQRAADWAVIGQSLAEHGDLLLYGCNVAADETGRAFVDAIARFTGADVAASSNLTGDAHQGGDWLLEYQTGTVATGINASLADTGYDHTLASTLTVTTTTDTTTINSADGVSFSEAVLSAAAGDTVLLPSSFNSNAVTNLAANLTLSNNLTFRSEGYLRLGGTNTLTIPTGIELTFNNSSTGFYLMNPIAGVGTIIASVSGGASLIFTSTSNSGFTGTIRMTAGFIQAESASSFGGATLIATDTSGYYT